MGLSTGHLLLLLVIVMIFMGPSRLPNLGRSLGEAIRGFKDGLDGSGEDEKKAKLKDPSNKSSDQA